MGRGEGIENIVFSFYAIFTKKGKDLWYNLTTVLKQEKEMWVVGGWSNQWFSVLRSQVGSQLHLLGMQILKPIPNFLTEMPSKLF